MSPISQRARRRAPITVIAGSAVAAAFAIGVAAAASASPLATAPTPTLPTTSSASPTETTAPPSETPILATITVELDREKTSGPKVLYVSNVPVGAGSELTPYDVEENPSEFCGGVYVDVSLNPDTITVTGDGSGDCYFDSITVTVVLNGATFASVTTQSDNLLVEPLIEEGPGGELPPDEAAGLGSYGTFRMGRSVITALDAPFPTLATVSASGSTFVARWTGSQLAGLADASAVFSFVRTAPGATASAANPVFTG